MKKHIPTTLMIVTMIIVLLIAACSPIPTTANGVPLHWVFLWFLGGGAVIAMIIGWIVNKINGSNKK